MNWILQQSLQAMVAESACVALLLGWVYWRFFSATRKRMKAYIERVSTCGFLSDPPTEGQTRWFLRLARFLAFIQVGRVKIVGRENLDNVPGPVIVAPNHPHSADVAVLPILMNGPARYLAARGVFTFGGGFGALIAGPGGAIAVDLTHGKGGAAREAAVNVLCSNQKLVMFPEGWAYLDGKMGPFKRGCVRIAKEAAHRLGKETYVVPVFLRYGKYAGHWITKLPPPLEYFLVFLFFPYFRRGVTVTVGKPIAASQIPADDCEATEMLRQHICSLDPTGRNGEP